MTATLKCTLHRATAKQPLPPPPPIVLTLQGAGVTERTEEFTEFKNAQTSLGETVRAPMHYQAIWSDFVGACGM